MKSLLALLCLLSALPDLARAGGFSDRHVLILGVDGVLPSAIAPARATNLLQLAAAGVASWDAYAGGQPGTITRQQTVSGPGWGSILTGVWSNQHRIVDNKFAGYDASNYPHFFRRLKEANPAAFLSSIVEWDPIDAELVGPVAAWTDFRQRAAVYTTTDLVAKAVAHLGSADPDVLFLHFDAVDHAGHASGYGVTNAAYLDALARVDDGIGAVLAAVRARPNYSREQWLVLAVTDHGGTGRGHGGQSAAERTIFVFAAGPGLAPRTVSPGPGMCCIAPTVLAWLGVPIAREWNWAEPPFGVAGATR